MSAPPGAPRVRPADRAPSRRALLAGGSALAASLAACADLLSRTEIASRYLVDPALDAYRPVLDALAATLLPLEEERFPLHDAEPVTARLLELFALEEERRFLGLQKTLLLFDRVELFPFVDGPIEESERAEARAFGAPDYQALERELEEKRRREQKAWTTFSERLGPGSPRFTALALAERRAYLALWAESEFVLRREFRNTIRALFFSAVYSLDEVWAAIGYEGPLVGQAARQESGT